MIEQSERDLSIFSKNGCLAAAVATPVDADFRPEPVLAAAWAKRLLASGCDGLTLLGTTGEGPEFSIADRRALLERFVADGIDPARLMISISTQSIPETVELIRHGLDTGIVAQLLMPPCIFRQDVTDDGTVDYYSAVIERVRDERLELFLYHFPAISGVAITTRVVRRLDERFPGIIAGIKDSSEDLDHTQALLRRFSHLSVFTGSEIHVPDALAQGGHGTICGMANVMPRLMRAMMDAPTTYDRRQFVPLLRAIDTVLCRRPFVASTKAVIAHVTGQAAWRRVVPPMTGYTHAEEQRMVGDFRKWEAGLPPAWRSLFDGPGRDI